MEKQLSKTRILAEEHNEKRRVFLRKRFRTRRIIQGKKSIILRLFYKLAMFS